MDNRLGAIVAQTLNLRESQVNATLQLFEQGATLPFIARYRKEQTGNLDEQAIAQIRDEQERLKAVEQRKATIIETIREQGNLTPELEKQLNETWELQTLEDLYLPYRPKRQARATKARDAGLEPLAQKLWQQKPGNPESWAQHYLSESIPDANQALQGARDIVAEWISEHAKARQVTRRLYQKAATLETRVIAGKKDEGRKYQDYFDYQEKLRRIPAHRLLAVLRAEQEGILRIKLGPPKAEALQKLLALFRVNEQQPAGQQVAEALTDGYQRLLKPSMDTQFRKEAKAAADAEAIQVFGENLRQRLLAPPLGNKPVLAIDPGFRSGCKIAVLDANGTFQTSATIYPHPPQLQTAEAAQVIDALADQYRPEAIGVGNGTAGRETLQWLKSLKALGNRDLHSVDEDGASVYSASDTARKEFPDLDITVRGAISIGRRLMDPLAELVKIDPKSLGIGQYQHDVDQKALKAELDRIVQHCVNKVGVNLNTASQHLLAYVAGLGPTLAQNIVDHRLQHGAFPSRAALKKVPKLGPKAYEQAAGFLRAPGSQQPLDNSAVHPESYGLVTQMANGQNCTVQELLNRPEKRQQIPWGQYLSDQVGWPTLNDIKAELEKPGRDPRPSLEPVQFSDKIQSLEDLKAGMRLPGVITNLTKFGAFVDIGLKVNGLVHISEMADTYVKDPADIVSLHQQVQVSVLSVDYERQRIQLSLKR